MTTCKACEQGFEPVAPLNGPAAFDAVAQLFDGTQGPFHPVCAAYQNRRLGRELDPRLAAYRQARRENEGA